MANPVNRMLWWALTMSLPIYVVVAHVANVQPSETAQIPLLTGIFAVMSFGLAAGTVLYRRVALVRPIQTGALDPSTPAGAQKAFTPFILNLVLSEAVGIYGLVLSFLSGNPLFSLVFSLAAFLLMWIHRPTAPALTPPLAPHQRGLDSTPIT